MAEIIYLSSPISKVINRDSMIEKIFNFSSYITNVIWKESLIETQFRVKSIITLYKGLKSDINDGG